jgi:hypothetical protein
MPPATVTVAVVDAPEADGDQLVFDNLTGLAADGWITTWVALTPPDVTVIVPTLVSPLVFAVKLTVLATPAGCEPVGDNFNQDDGEADAVHVPPAGNTGANTKDSAPSPSGFPNTVDSGKENLAGPAACVTFKVLVTGPAVNVSVAVLAEAVGFALTHTSEPGLTMVSISRLL